ncbi:MAG TPA: hypothetical protein VF519_01900 [Mycobacteriales bacterium]|jgi:hypothetical protein
MTRSLVLRKETLSTLTSDELAGVNGADVQATPLCVTGAALCRLSDQAISLCGCLTSYCSVNSC